MCDFGMELQAEDRQRLVPDGSNRAGLRMGQWKEIVRYFRYLVSMTHPNVCFNVYIREQSNRVINVQAGTSVLSCWSIADLTSQGIASQLHAVTDAKNRQAHLEYFGIALRCVIFVDARWSTGEYQSAWLVGANLLGRNVVPNNFTIDIQFPYAAGD